ncbi:hypothetical protein [Achromobacter sp.]|uniref:hypothetical protein n=1 Tax=Achromobacter sp. TaxID=134375 RepID=UPI0028AFF668|nr:hypothetical protein [Achromobacter sp.]
MKPPHAVLKSHHYSADKFSTSYVSGEALYSEIEFDQAALIRQDGGYVNTCATRMSLALIKAGVPFNGRLTIKHGKYKGRTVEPGAKLLADQIARPHSLGKPLVFEASDAPPGEGAVFPAPRLVLQLRRAGRRRNATGAESDFQEYIGLPARSPKPPRCGGAGAVLLAKAIAEVENVEQFYRLSMPAIGWPW